MAQIADPLNTDKGKASKSYEDKKPNSYFVWKAVMWGGKGYQGVFPYAGEVVPLLCVTGSDATHCFLLPKLNLWLQAWLCSPVLVLVEDIEWISHMPPSHQTCSFNEKLPDKKVSID